jgi:hypothetical protein
MIARLDGTTRRRWGIRGVALGCALVVVRLVVPWWCGRDAAAWLRGDPEIQHQLAAELVAFEASDAAHRASHADRFTGEWALVAHQTPAATNDRRG